MRIKEPGFLSEPLEKFAMKRWLIPLLALLVSSSLINAGQEEDDAFGLNTCPENCECVQGTGEGTVVNCYTITPTQRFQENVVGFNLLHNADHLSPPLELTRRFFVELGIKNVQSITITVDIAFIDRYAFEGLDSLNYVNLTDNNLAALHPDTFASNKGLRILSLSKNSIIFSSSNQSYNDDALLNISDLSELDLSFCQIYNLSSNAFNNLPDLVYINLGSNYLVDINEKTFQNITELEELDLSDNNIRALSPDTFLNVENLFTLRLSNNPIASIENVKFPGINTLDLSFCKFNELNSASFSSLTDIVNLNLSGNGLTALNADVFTHMSQLLNLDLSNNNLGQLDDRLFTGNYLLETLSLKNNPEMKLWPEEGFMGNFENLYGLDISNTGIQTFAPNAFKNMSFLAHFDLSKNSIKTLEIGVLPRRIKYLSLESNNIISLGDLNFPKEFQVRHLFLAGNQLTYLNQKHFINLPYLVRLDVSSCALETVWSESSSKLSSLKTVRKLNLSKNRLQKILPDDLKVFSSLEMLDIRQNPLICGEDLQKLSTFLHDSTIEPMGPSNRGNIDENMESFLWDDIWENCNHQQNGQNHLGEGALKPLPQRTSTSKPIEILAVSTNELDSVPYEYDDDYNDKSEEIDSIYKPEYSKPDNGQNDYKPDDVPHNHLRYNPDVVEVQVSRTSSFVIVFLSALGMTLVVTLLLALITTLCKHKLSRLNDNRKRRRRDGSLSYQQLYDNEHPNSPTTPIVKTKSTSLPHVQGVTRNVGGEGFNQKDGQVTYLSSSFHHANITPERE